MKDLLGRAADAGVSTPFIPHGGSERHQIRECSEVAGLGSQRCGIYTVGSKAGHSWSPHMQCYELPVSTNSEATQVLSQCELIMLDDLDVCFTKPPDRQICVCKSCADLELLLSRSLGASGNRAAVIPRRRHCIRRSNSHTDIKAHVWSKSLQMLL